MEEEFKAKYADFPADCPLPGAIPCEMEVFLVCKKSLEEQDRGFKTALDRSAFSDAVGDEVCQRYGLSVYDSHKNCEEAAKRLTFLGKIIVKATLTPERGRIKATPAAFPGHHTWWPYPDQLRSTGFVVSEEN